MWKNCIGLICLMGLAMQSFAQSADKNVSCEEMNAVFSNPLIWADVPDVDVIRVGSDYYMVSTTMFLTPGAPIMRSKDLVSWEIISYLFDRFDDDESYNLNGGNSYARGQWASSIRYHNGKFYVLFGTGNTNRSFIFSTTDPAGKWDKVVIDEYIHDAGLLFDDDGKIYVVSGNQDIRLRELNSSMTGIKKDGIDKTINIGPVSGLLEGSHLYKIKGKYYLLMIGWPPNEMRTQYCLRADRIEGPYENKIILRDDMGFKNNGVAQGAIVDTPEGDWYAMLFQDHGAVGRIPMLMPVRWVDDWPMLGDENGKVPFTMKKPVPGYQSGPLVISDEFDNRLSKNKKQSTLALNWQWNHNPDNALWSLTQRPGYLRLTTGKIVSHVFEARNTLSQRTEGPYCMGKVAMDVSNMKDGDCAGFSAFCYFYGMIAVKKEGDRKYISMINEDKEIERVLLCRNIIYLKINCDFTSDKAYFSYSLDSQNWHRIGNELQMKYTTDHFIGYRFALINYATKEAGGYVDFDYFRYEREFQGAVTYQE